jgi:transcriptional regulator with XRE-family HTH domain
MKQFASIADARKAAAFTQESLAERIGVSRGAVAQWEMGEGTRPDPTNAAALVRLLPGLTWDAIYPTPQGAA